MKGYRVVNKKSKKKLYIPEPGVSGDRLQGSHHTLLHTNKTEAVSALGKRSSHLIHSSFSVPFL